MHGPSRSRVEAQAEGVAARRPRDLEPRRRFPPARRRSGGRRARSCRARARARAACRRRGWARTAPAQWFDRPPSPIPIEISAVDEARRRTASPVPFRPRDLRGDDPRRGPPLRRAPAADDRGDPVRARAGARARLRHRRDDPAAARPLSRDPDHRARLEPGDGVQGASARLGGDAPRADGGPAARRPLGPGGRGALGPPPRRRRQARPVPPRALGGAGAGDRRRGRGPRRAPGRLARPRASTSPHRRPSRPSGAAARCSGRPTTWR